MSVIETPPKDRLAIHTVVAPYDPEVIRQAIELELGRGGQVYFVHNRVESIWARAAEIQQLVPECRIAVAHGQMPESQLEKAMIGFMRRDYDLLACTTIIENGLDNRSQHDRGGQAQNYGLSELVPDSRRAWEGRTARLRLPAGTAGARVDRHLRGNGWRR
jgi:transcription-repair coupling factor (superfamily II helicase)